MKFTNLSLGILAATAARLPGGARAFSATATRTAAPEITGARALGRACWLHPFSDSSCTNSRGHAVYSASGDDAFATISAASLRDAAATSAAISVDSGTTARRTTTYTTTAAAGDVISS